MTRPISAETWTRVDAMEAEPDEDTNESMVIVRGAASSEPPA